ncbi:glycosyl transferase-like protein [Novymonas esmeraldas]|uniref:Glycosyl transferase-like protein n=1 Tax=Novymonas esmeraldas TaxID=1808958 RepID=A0AAW0EWM5_9TRYP
MKVSHLRRLQRRAVDDVIALEHIFVINLDRRPDRWAAVQAVCAGAGLPAARTERVSAVDGAGVDVVAAHRCGFVSALGLRRLQEPPRHHIWGMDLNKAALGCALSHIHLWARIAALGSVADVSAGGSAAAPARPTRCCLVLEDDAALVPDTRGSGSGDDGASTSSPASFLADLHGRLRHVPSDWELLYVGGLDTAGQCPMMQVAPGVARVPQYHRTTSAYLLTPRGARRLLATSLPLTFQLDTAMTMNVGYPPSSSGGGTAGGAATLPYVLDPVCYTLQPPLLQQAAELGTDIQHAAA